MKKNQSLLQRFSLRQENIRSAELTDGSRVAVMGGGPAGSFFSYFLLEMANKQGISLQVDIYEPRDFTTPGPPGCNMCGGIVSESLVQTLALEGINLKPTVVKQGIESYVLHTNEGSVRVSTAIDEARIAAVFRGAGPRDSSDTAQSFDGLLQNLVEQQGARLIHERVTAVTWDHDRPQIKSKNGMPQTYDLLAVAVGVNSAALRLFETMGLSYQPPLSTKSYIREYRLGRDKVETYLGSAMHVFLLNIARLKFAAAIPKGDYVTLALLGEGLDSELVQTVLDSPEVRNIMPPEWDPKQPACQCAPSMYVRGATQPFGHRIVFIGDCAANRLYKDGIGGAHRTARAAASTAIFQGVSAEAFRQHYWSSCRAIDGDNIMGRLMFGIASHIQRRGFMRQAVLHMTACEQGKGPEARRMSMILWDMFSGSAPYKEIFMRCLHPRLLGGLVWSTIVSNFHSRKSSGTHDLIPEIHASCGVPTSQS